MATTESSLRLSPVQRSWNPLVWLAALTYRMTTGRTGVPIQVIYARAPGLIIAHLVLMATAEYLTTLDRRTRTLVRVYGSKLNNCMFCDDLEAFMALKHRSLTREELNAVPRFATDDHFSSRDRAAMQYVHEVNTTRVATDETFAALRAHFSEREVVGITWVNAVNNYLNLQAKPLGIGNQGYCPLPTTEKPPSPSAEQSDVTA